MRFVRLSQMERVPPSILDHIIMDLDITALTVLHLRRSQQILHYHNRVHIVAQLVITGLIQQITTCA